MAKFLIEPHFRLQEWVAEEKDYFRKEGLEYEFRELMRATRRGGYRFAGFDRAPEAGVVILRHDVDLDPAGLCAEGPTDDVMISHL